MLQKIPATTGMSFKIPFFIREPHTQRNHDRPSNPILPLQPRPELLSPHTTCRA